MNPLEIQDNVSDSAAAEQAQQTAQDRPAQSEWECPPAEQARPEAAESDHTGRPSGGIAAAVRRFFHKTPRKVLIPAAIAAALLLVFVIAGNAILLKVAPSAALSNAMAKTGKAMEKRLEQSPYQAFAVLGRSLASGGKLECSCDYNNGWSSVQLDFDLAGSFKNRQFEGGFDIESDGVPMDLRLYFDKEQAAVTSSYLDGAWYGMTYGKFEDDLNASALVDFAGLSQEQIQEAVKTVEQWTALLNQDSKTSYQPYAEAIQEFYDGLEWNTSSEKVKVGGKKVSAAAIVVEVSVKQVRSLVMDLYDITASSETARDTYVTGQMANGGRSRQELEQEFDAQMRQGRQSLQAGLDQLTGNLELTYYVYQRSVVKIEAEGEITVAGSTAQLLYTVDLGCDPATDDWLLECTVCPVGENPVSMRLSYSSEEKKKKYEDSLELSFTDGRDTFGFYIDNEWNLDNGRLDTVLSLDEGSGRQSMRIGGKLNVAKDQFKLKLTEFDGIELRWEEGNAFTIAAKAGVKPSKPAFVNLDQWDETVMDTFQSAYQALQQAQYGDTNSYTLIPSGEQTPDSGSTAADTRR